MKTTVYVEKGAEKHFEEICREHGVGFKRGNLYHGHLVKYLMGGEEEEGEVVGCGSGLCEECDREFGSDDCAGIRRDDNHKLKYE